MATTAFQTPPKNAFTYISSDHLMAATIHHFKAANYLEDGNYEKAAQCATLAQEYISRASGIRQEETYKGIVKRFLTKTFSFLFL
jgi:hypothetical protein